MGKGSYCEFQRFGKIELFVITQNTFVIAHKGYFLVCDHSEWIYDCSCQYCKYCILNLHLQNASGKAGKGSYCEFQRFGKIEVLVIAQNTFVIAHKDYFQVCDRSELPYDRS